MKENSIEEDMKILEEFKTHGYSILLIKYEDRNKTNLKIEQAIEHILSDYKRVLQENEKLKAKLLDTLEGQKVIKEETPQYIKENYILKEKVKNMIKEKEWALENYDCDKSDYKQSQAIGAWDILQKLLKESEE